MISVNPLRLWWRTERRILQAVMALACLVPLVAGGSGMIRGLPTDGGGMGITAIAWDSHYRYLSGLLFAIGVFFAVSIARIETHGRRIRLLATLVVIGGIGRLIGVIFVGMPSFAMVAALGMELVVTPLLALWQARVSRARP
jgi:hypothetical protein